MSELALALLAACQPICVTPLATAQESGYRVVSYGTRWVGNGYVTVHKDGRVTWCRCTREPEQLAELKAHFADPRRYR